MVARRKVLHTAPDINAIKRCILLTAIILAVRFSARAETQHAKLPRVGIIHQGGPYYRAIDGLIDGLRELTYERGKHFSVEIRDGNGDRKAVEEAAKSFERDGFNLIYTLAGSVTTAAKQVTIGIPIVFAVGSDPTLLKLVNSFSHPAGVHFMLTDLTGKRLEIFKEIVPRLRRVLTFYNPNNRGAKEAAKLANETASAFGISLMERHVETVEDLKQGLKTLNVKELDGYFFTSDAMVASQAQLIVNAGRTKKFPTMFHEGSLVAQGGLASYGLSFHEIGPASAKYVHRVLTGTKPGELPVETVDKLELTVNLATAKALRLIIPHDVLVRADKVIR